MRLSKAHVRLMTFFLSLLLVLSLFGASFSMEAHAAGNSNRIAGKTAYETSMETLNRYLEATGKTKLDAVILATGASYQDGISGSYLAKVADAPILLINPNSVEKGIKFVAGKLNKDSNVYILGGEAALPEGVETILNSFGFENIERLAGDTAIETNLKILEKADEIATLSKKASKELLVATVASHHDAMAAGATGKPILLVRSSVSQEQLEYLGSRGYSSITILGGTKAVSSGVENKLKQTASVNRVSGATAIDTAVALAEKYYGKKSNGTILVHNGTFHDGLSACSLAQVQNAPILLTSTSSPYQAYNYQKKYNIKWSLVLGGTGQIPDTIMAVGGKGLSKGWNKVGSNYVYVDDKGYIATKPFVLNKLTITPDKNGLITPQQKNGFIWPLNGTISSYFGYRSAYAGGYYIGSNHTGLDISANYYTPIKAVWDGTVVYPTGWNGTYGKMVTIDHGNGLVTRYAHNSTIKVKVGQKVKQGDIISLVGATGLATGPHLHFEVKVNGNLVNPLKYLP